VSRLGAEGAADEISDEGLGSLVQAFEVQKEHASPGRYVGTFSVQFRPVAVRAFLDKRGMDYTEKQSHPMVVLPVLSLGGEHTVLWEEMSSWRNAWAEIAKTTRLVPIIVPPGELADIALISTSEAVEGNAERLQALIRKYQAGGAVVALLKPVFDEKGDITGGEVLAYRYDLGGQAYEPFSLTLSQVEEEDVIVIEAEELGGKTAQEEIEKTPELLLDAVRKIVDELENRWKEKVRETNVTGPALVMAVQVPVSTLAMWTQIKSRLGQIPSVIRTNVVTMSRGLVHIELAFRGDLSSLQDELNEQDLEIKEAQPGMWVLGEYTESYSFF
ncbi:MAG TPA: hypothetical protein DD400_01755, partial [Rhodospirillaceae bacterium]|nr:hypothetical protein [Rhodospirillaceae bacterium]